MTSTNDNHEIQFSVLRNDLRKRDPKTGDEPATRADGSKYVSRLMPQSEVAAAIRKNLKIAAATERVRKLYAADQVSGGDDYANGKKQMISILPGVGAPAGTQVKGMSAEFHNCCYGFDFDENQVDIAAALSALREWPHTLMAGHSVSLVGGYGIFLGPKAKTLAEYKHNWIEIEKRLPDGLAVNSGSASKNLNRERFLAADPDLYSNSDAIPITDLPPYNPDAGKRKSTSGREKQQPPKDHPHLAAWRELLASTAPKFASGTSTYNDWLAIAMDLELVDPTGDLLKIWLTAPGRKDSYGGRGGAEDKPAAKAAAAIRTILEKHGVDCSSVKLKRRVQTVKGEDDGKEDIWYAIGRFVGKTKLSDTYHYDPELRCWWEWKDGNHWHILPSDATDIIDAVQRDKYRIAAALEQTIGRDAADQWTDKKQWSHNKARASEFYTGLRDALRRELSPLPDYLVAVKNGVLDLKTGALSQHSPAAPYRVTAVAAGAYLKDADVSAVHDRLKPAIPDAARREMFLDASAVQFGGLAGGDIKGSMLYLVGDNGGGKGNSQRYVRTTFGGLAMAGNAEALSPRMSGDINNHLATIIEKRPRMLTFAEPEKLPMPRILSITGYDELTARGPHKPEVTAQLHCGVMVTAVVALLLATPPLARVGD